MGARSVLKDFRRKRKYLNNLGEQHATERLTGMWEFLTSEGETSLIIDNITIKNPDISARIRAGQAAKAGLEEEVIVVGLYVMEACHIGRDRNTITGIAKGLQIVSLQKMATRQTYVDDVMKGYVDYALNFIDEELDRMAAEEGAAKQNGNSKPPEKPSVATETLDDSKVEKKIKGGLTYERIENITFDENLSISDFSSTLTETGKVLLGKLVEMIGGDSSFKIEVATANYINVKIKKPVRVALQIHRVVDNNSELGLAVVGWDKGWHEIQNKYAIASGDINRLSGLHDSTQEEYWLRGKINSAAKGNLPPYEAKVYILAPGSLGEAEAWEEVDEILQWAKESTRKGKGDKYGIKLYKDVDTNIDIDGLVELLNMQCSYINFTAGERLKIDEDKISSPNTHLRISELLEHDEGISRRFFFTERQYDDNYFFHTHKKLTIASIFGWNSLTELPMNNGATYFIATIIALEIDNSFRHGKATGCIYDFLKIKNDIDDGMKEGRVCQSCLKRIEANLSNENKLLLNDLRAILNRLSQTSKQGLDILELAGKEETTDDDVESKTSSIGSGCYIRRVASSEEQCLNVHSYANVLNTFFKKAKGDGEFCFGLFGHWGRGKTYLMDMVKNELKDDKDSPYETIFFSAWKYRTTPEAWVHLYEAFADCLTETRNCIKLLPYLVRTGVIRLGIWPIIICILFFGTSLIPLNQYVTGILLPLLSLLGIAGTLFFVRMLFGFRRITPVIKQYITLKRHNDKLGLQALIGKDLKSLIMGWVPLNIFKGSFLKLGLIYLVVVSLVGFLLFPIKPQGLPAWLSISTGTHGWLSWLVFSIWLIISIWIMFFVIFGERKTKQLLLVIDDLDRCKPEQMLEIMESLKLLLEDKDIHERIQVVMLVDEEMLRHAIQKKFTDFMKGDNTKTEGGNKTRVINEHIEKLFACYLRLPELSVDEVAEVTRKYVEVHNTSNLTDTKQPEVSAIKETEKSIEKPLEVDMQEGDAFEDKFVEEEAFEPKNEVEITIADTLYEDDEKELLIGTITFIASQDKTRAWGPRSIRALLFKYQLCRLLLMTLKIDFASEELIDELSDAICGVFPPDAEETRESNNIRKVINQVI